MYGNLLLLQCSVKLDHLPIPVGSHIIFVFLQDFDNIEDIATDEELDMLDLAFGLTDTSRLGCQVANCSA